MGCKKLRFSHHRRGVLKGFLGGDIRAVNPPLLQILRIGGEGMTDDVIMHGT